VGLDISSKIGLEMRRSKLLVTYSVEVIRTALVDLLNVKSVPFVDLKAVFPNAKTQNDFLFHYATYTLSRGASVVLSPYFPLSAMRAAQCSMTHIHATTVQDIMPYMQLIESSVTHGISVSENMIRLSSSGGVSRLILAYLNHFCSIQELNLISYGDKMEVPMYQRQYGVVPYISRSMKPSFNVPNTSGGPLGPHDGQRKLLWVMSAVLTMARVAIYVGGAPGANVLPWNHNLRFFDKGFKQIDVYDPAPNVARGFRHYRRLVHSIDDVKVPAEAYVVNIDIRRDIPHDIPNTTENWEKVVMEDSIAAEKLAMQFSRDPKCLAIISKAPTRFIDKEGFHTGEFMVQPHYGSGDSEGRIAWVRAFHGDMRHRRWEGTLSTAQQWASARGHTPGLDRIAENYMLSTCFSNKKFAPSDVREEGSLHYFGFSITNTMNPRRYIFEALSSKPWVISTFPIRSSVRVVASYDSNVTYDFLSGVVTVKRGDNIFSDHAYDPHEFMGYYVKPISYLHASLVSGSSRFLRTFHHSPSDVDTHMWAVVSNRPFDADPEVQTILNTHTYMMRSASSFIASEYVLSRDEIHSIRRKLVREIGGVPITHPSVHGFVGQRIFTGGILWAHSGAGKTFLSMSDLKLIDGDSLIQWPAGRWFDDPDTARKVEQHGWESMIRYHHAHPGVIILTALAPPKNIQSLLRGIAFWKVSRRAIEDRRAVKRLSGVEDQPTDLDPIEIDVPYALMGVDEIVADDITMNDLMSVPAFLSPGRDSKLISVAGHMSNAVLNAAAGQPVDWVAVLGYIEWNLKVVKGVRRAVKLYEKYKGKKQLDERMSDEPKPVMWHSYMDFSLGLIAGEIIAKRVLNRGVTEACPPTMYILRRLKELVAKYPHFDAEGSDASLARSTFFPHSG
jgi:hypothetical protein